MRFTVALMAGMLLMGCTNGDTTGGPDTKVPPTTDPTPLSPAITLSSSEGGLQTGVTAKNFNFSQLRNIWVRVTVPTLTKTTQVNLVFRNPLGEPMYETNVLYSADPQTTSMMMAGSMAPVAVSLAKHITGGYAIDVAVPVAGTVLTRYPTSGVGDWTVQAKVDGLDKALMTGMTVAFSN